MALDRLKTYDITLTAGVDFPVSADGNLFFIQASSAILDVTFDSENTFKSQRQGARIKFDKPYERFILSSSSSQSIRIVVGFGDFDNTVESVLAILVPATAMDTINDVTVSSSAVVIAPLNALRREVGITVDPAASNGIRIGDSAVTATSGMLLQPGVSVFLSTTSAIYGIRDGGADVTVSATEIS